MNELSKIWQDIVNYCQQLFENNRDLTEVSKKPVKTGKKKKKSR
jgi:hypothetical protein